LTITSKVLPFYKGELMHPIILIRLSSCMLLLLGTYVVGTPPPWTKKCT